MDSMEDASQSFESPLSFRKILERGFSKDVFFLSWSPEMDLLGVVLGPTRAAAHEQQFSVHRLSWQKAFSISQDELFIQDAEGHDRAAKTPFLTTLGWRPDGQVILCGQTGGILTLVSVEGGKPLFAHSLRRDVVLPHFDQVPLTALHWKQADETVLSERAAQLPLSSTILLPLDPLPKEDGNAAARSWVASRELLVAGAGGLDVVVAADALARVSLAAYGVFPIGFVEVARDIIESAAGGNTDGGCSTVVAACPVSVQLAPDFRSLAVLTKVILKNVPSYPSSGDPVLSPDSGPDLGLFPVTPRPAMDLDGSLPLSVSELQLPAAASADARTTMGTENLSPLNPAPNIDKKESTPSLSKKRHRSSSGARIKSRSHTDQQLRGYRGPFEQQVWLVLYDTSILVTCGQEIRALSDSVMRVRTPLCYLEDACTLLRRKWKEGYGHYVETMKKFDLLLKEHGEKRCAREEFVALLSSGVTGPALRQFLEHTLNVKGVSRLRTRLDGVFEECQRLCTTAVSRAADHLYSAAVDLHALAQHTIRFEKIGLMAQLTQSVVDAAGKLVLMGSQLATELSRSRHMYFSFFSWLHTTVLRLVEESGMDPNVPERRTRIGGAPVPERELPRVSVDIGAVAALLGASEPSGNSGPSESPAKTSAEPQASSLLYTRRAGSHVEADVVGVDLFPRNRIVDILGASDGTTAANAHAHPASQSLSECLLACQEAIDSVLSSCSACIGAQIAQLALIPLHAGATVVQQRNGKGVTGLDTTPTASLGGSGLSPIMRGVSSAGSPLMRSPSIGFVPSPLVQTHLNASSSHNKSGSGSVMLSQSVSAPSIAMLSGSASSIRTRERSAGRVGVGGVPGSGIGTGLGQGAVISRMLGDVHWTNGAIGCFAARRPTPGSRSAGTRLLAFAQPFVEESGPSSSVIWIIEDGHELVGVTAARGDGDVSHEEARYTMRVARLRVSGHVSDMGFMRDSHLVVLHSHPMSMVDDADPTSGTRMAQSQEEYGQSLSMYEVPKPNSFAEVDLNRVAMWGNGTGGDMQTLFTKLASSFLPREDAATQSESVSSATPVHCKPCKTRLLGYLPFPKVPLGSPLVPVGGGGTERSNPIPLPPPVLPSRAHPGALRIAVGRRGTCAVLFGPPARQVTVFDLEDEEDVEDDEESD